jgi:peptidoglycan/LPS O-acetylase OafA/YrhL
MDKGNDLSPSYWAILAYTRFALASIVVAAHLGAWFPSTGLLDQIHRFGGGFAVSGFFIISGISVAHSYQVAPKGFYQRRFLRIYPAYFLAVLFSFLVMILLPVRVIELGYIYSYKQSWWDFLGQFFFLQDFFVHRLLVNGALWSLSIEVFWYAFTPLLTRFPTWILYVLWTVLIYLFSWLPYLPAGDVSILCSWAWLNGFLLIQDKWNAVSKIFVVLGVYSIYYNCYARGDWNSLWGYGFLLVILFGFKRIRLSDTACNIGNYFGKLSYPLYLIHYPTITLVCAGLHCDSLFLAIVAVFSATLMIYRVGDEWTKEAFWKPLLQRVGLD